MTQADDDGLRLPPRVAPAHVVIVPILRGEASRDWVLDVSGKLAAQLRSGTAGGEYRAAQTFVGISDYAALAERFRPEGAGGFIVGKWSGNPSIDGKLAELNLTLRCLPHEQSGTEGRCLVTGKSATLDAVYAKAY